MNRRLPAVVLGLAVAAGSNSVHAEDYVSGQGDSIDETTSPVMIRTDQRTSLRIFQPFDPTVTYAVNSPIVYLHRCVGTARRQCRGGGGLSDRELVDVAPPVSSHRHRLVDAPVRLLACPGRGPSGGSG